MLSLSSIHSCRLFNPVLSSIGQYALHAFLRRPGKSCRGSGRPARPPGHPGAAARGPPERKCAPRSKHGAYAGVFGVPFIIRLHPRALKRPPLRRRPPPTPRVCSTQLTRYILQWQSQKPAALTKASAVVDEHHNRGRQENLAAELSRASAAAAAGSAAGAKRGCE